MQPLIFNFTSYCFPLSNFRPKQPLPLVYKKVNLEKLSKFKFWHNTPHNFIIVMNCNLTQILYIYSYFLPALRARTSIIYFLFIIISQANLIFNNILIFKYKIGRKSYVRHNFVIFNLLYIKNIQVKLFIKLNIIRQTKL